MQLLAVVAMLVGATSVGVAIAWSRRRREAGTLQRAATRREVAEASIAAAVLAAGGARDLEQQVSATWPGTIVRDIDVVNWAEALRHDGGEREAAAFLERLVAAVAAGGGRVPVVQYSMLLDVVFALGFHSDELARLRSRYGFEYVDPAAGRPRGGEAGAGERLYDARPEAGALHLLGLAAGASPREIVAAWRRAAAATHPDRFHAAPERERDAAAAKFMELTQAADLLLRRRRD